MLDKFHFRKDTGPYLYLRDIVEALAKEARGPLGFHEISEDLIFMLRLFLPVNA